MIQILRYVGSKTQLAKTIIKLLDYNKTTYIELFGGTATVLLNKPPHKIEIYNDTNQNLFNLFSTIASPSLFPIFYSKTQLLLFHENIFRTLKSYNPSNQIESALKTFILSNMSVNGNGYSFGYSVKRNNAEVLQNKIKKLIKAYERLKSVQILNKDFTIILEKIKNNPDVILYADPPYIDKEHYYKSSKNIHTTLAHYLNQAPYKFILSYYPHPSIPQLYPNMFLIPIQKKTSANANKYTRPLRTELLITNFKPNHPNTTTVKDFFSSFNFNNI